MYRISHRFLVPGWSAKPLVSAHDRIMGTHRLAILDELVRGPGNEWERRDVAEHAAQMLESAQQLQDTVEYRRLRAALIERGLLN